MMAQVRPYPDEIKQRWANAVKQLNLSDAQQRYITQLVSYAQPPLTLDGFRQAATFYDHDCNPLIRVEAKFLSAIIGTAEEQNIGTYYPVFFALTTPRLLGSLNCAVSHEARLLLSNWFSEIEESQTVSRHNFYAHLLSVRHILRVVINSGWREKSPHETHSSYFLDAIRSDFLYSQRLGNEQHYKVFVALATLALAPGEKIRDTNNGGGGSGSNTGQKTEDVWHKEHLKQCVTAPPPKKRRVGTPKHDTRLLSPHQLADPELCAIGLQHKTPISPQRSTSEEATEETTLQRSTASTLTRHDDRRFAQRWSNAAPTSSLATVSDLSRLPPSRIDEILSSPMDAISQVFVRLLLATGLPPRRLMSLSLRSHMNDISNHTQTETPYLISHGDETILCYRLLNGAVLDPQSPQNQWLTLVLPTALAQPLLTHATDAKTQHPFRGIYASVNRHLKRYFLGKSGITPTVNRITSSSWLWRRPNARDDTAAGIFSGQFDLSLAAPAAYRCLSRTEIQKSFNATLAHLGVTADTYAQSETSSPPNPPLYMGSAVACNARFFQPIFQNLLGNIRSAATPCSEWYVGKPFPCEALASLYQFVAAYELLGWQLSSGARPLGKRSHNRIGKYLQWVHDKDSARGTESRVIPVAADTRNGITALQRWTRSLISVLSQQGIVLNDQRSGFCDTPAWLTTTHKGRRLLLRDMSWSDMTSLSLPALSTQPNNVTRHSLTSWLRLHLPDAQLDALLGHARHGRNLASPQGTSALGQQNLLRLELSRWLNQSGYQPLHWERLPWYV